jgi:hypothetical protein
MAFILVYLFYSLIPLLISTHFNSTALLSRCIHYHYWLTSHNRLAFNHDYGNFQVPIDLPLFL